ncbi:MULTISPECIES: amidohydrolase family protein [Rufibacter]|uniref:Imidazolonepropionase-like amidohydrolase n=1 Tax=Rufibacter quisquiliarum TaxID=1549639 RepID=A0A839GQY6_9BACT|nr:MULTISPECIES: amidohydrolase family protein [Rufibacter]MBA9076251.1 imidazolonepropionase-like amidohydrolase [Rufibacter quisquiliarum]
MNLIYNSVETTYKMRKAALLFAALLTGATAWAQVPVPAAKQTKAVAVTGATLHVGNGQVVEKATVAFENGKITYAGPASGFKAAGTAYETINAAGKHIYPGLIQPNSQIGLVEIESVRATLDQQEVGLLNPNVRSVVAYNTDSDIVPTLRNNGVLLAQVTPVGGLISGSSSVVQLDAWNWEDAVVKADGGLHLRWPAMLQSGDTSPAAAQRKQARQQGLQELETLLADASVYKQQAREKENLKLASLTGLFDGSKKLFLHVNYGKEMVEAVRFAQKAGIKNMVIVGGADALVVSDFLKENNIPVIYSGVHALPARAGDDVYLPYKMPGLLHQAGILFCLDYDASLHGTRNLPFIAGTAVAFGLPKEQALASVSYNAAKILGVEDKVGSIEVGKEATLVVSEGDLLDMRTNKVSHAFIQGRQLNLTDKQQYLYQKFNGKYNQGE